MSQIPCEIKVCGSGVVHIVFGNATIHLKKDDFVAFSSLVNQVAATLRPRPGLMMVDRRLRTQEHDD